LVKGVASSDGIRCRDGFLPTSVSRGVDEPWEQGRVLGIDQRAMDRAGKGASAQQRAEIGSLSRRMRTADDAER
jgi:hypothetical protein